MAGLLDSVLKAPVDLGGIPNDQREPGPGRPLRGRGVKGLSPHPDGQLDPTQQPGPIATHGSAADSAGQVLPVGGEGRPRPLGGDLAGDEDHNVVGLL